MSADQPVEEQPAEITLRFPTVEAFFDELLSKVFARQVVDIHETVWCPQWNKHPEAILRIEALWRSYEHLCRDGDHGLSAWILDHAEPNMERLFDPQGPFKYCSVRNGHKDMLERLATVGAPRIELRRGDLERGFASAEDFANVWLANVYRRQVTDVNDRVWCPQWWLHEEAGIRMTALWNSFQCARSGESVELSLWWLQHADPHMMRLFDPQGPFKYCSVRNGHKTIVQRLDAKVNKAQFLQPTEAELAAYKAQIEAQLRR